MLDELQTKLPNFDFASTLFLGFIDAQPLNSFQFFFSTDLNLHVSVHTCLPLQNDKLGDYINRLNLHISSHVQ